jgi:5'-nucleotidase
VPAKRDSWEQPGAISYQHSEGIKQEAEGTDAYILRIKKMVAVTPLNLDMTARVKFEDFEKLLRK